MPRAKTKEYRRKSDGFRAYLTADELAAIIDPADWELYADYVKAQLAPGEKARLAQLDHDGDGEPGGSKPAADSDAE